MREQEAGVGEFLRRYRLERGWSFRDAAKRVGIPHSRIDEVEKQVDARTGKRFAPSFKLLLKFAKGYGLPQEELLRLGGYALPAELAPDESRLLMLYRTLDAAGRQRIVDFACQVAVEPGDASTSAT